MHIGIFFRDLERRNIFTNTQLSEIIFYVSRRGDTFLSYTGSNSVIKRVNLNIAFLVSGWGKRTKNRPRPRRVFGPINILANILFRRTLKVKHLFYNGKVEPLSVSINTFLNWHFNIYCCVKSSMDLMYEPILQVFKVYFKVMKCYKSVPRSILIYAYE